MSGNREYLPYAIIETHFVFTDHRFIGLPPMSKLVYLILWCRAFVERRATLPAHASSLLSISRDTGADRRTVSKALHNCTAAGLLAIGEDGRITVLGVHGKGNVKWKDAPTEAQDPDQDPPQGPAKSLVELEGEGESEGEREGEAGGAPSVDPALMNLAFNAFGSESMLPGWLEMYPEHEVKAAIQKCTESGKRNASYAGGILKRRCAEGWPDESSGGTHSIDLDKLVSSGLDAEVERDRG